MYTEMYGLTKEEAEKICAALIGKMVPGLRHQNKETKMKTMFTHWMPLPPPPPNMDVVVRYLHKKTGGVYVIRGHGLLEVDLTPVTIYQAADGGMVWIRPTAEFEDGRFEALKAMEQKP